MFPRIGYEPRNDSFNSVFNLRKPFSPTADFAKLKDTSFSLAYSAAEKKGASTPRTILND
jgi:hypothetical protein